MRKLVTWIVVTVGIAALVRKLRGRKRAGATEHPTGADDPADELRQKLATTRESNGGATKASETEAPAPDPPVPTPSSESAIDERRADVHDEGRAAIDEMRKSAED